MKSRALAGMARALVAGHGGQVPSSMDALTALPGVGRKTANVVLGHAFNVPGLPVDRHVLRVANRLGLVRTDDAEAVEAALCALLPPDRWTRASDVLILHGRRVCRPQPYCDRCQVRAHCAYFRALGAKTPAPRRDVPAPRRSGRR
jgi:endonuclease-3